MVVYLIKVIVFLSDLYNLKSDKELRAYSTYKYDIPGKNHRLWYYAAF